MRPATSATVVVRSETAAELGRVDEEVVQIVDGLGDGGDPGGLKGELPQRPLP
jgi:hypothetical protein